MCLARKVRTGRVDVNGGAYNPLAPFGGYKRSGIGREMGEAGMDEFLEIKSIQLCSPLCGTAGRGSCPDGSPAAGVRGRRARSTRGDARRGAVQLRGIAPCGAGQRIEVSLADVALATVGNLGYLAEGQLSEQPRTRMGNQVYGDFGRDFRTVDGHDVMVVVLTERHWHELVKATGSDERMSALEQALHADFTDAADRYRHHEAIGRILTSWFEVRTRDKVDEVLRATSVLWSRYKTVAEASADTGESSLFNRVDQPGVGSHNAPGSPLMFGGRQYPAKPAPSLGEDTDQILRELLDLPRFRIAELHRRHVIG